MAAINSAQLESQLQGVNYPASKAELVRCVERNGADESICTVISSLPNQTYDSLAAVNRAVNALQQSTARQDQSQQGSTRQDQDRNHQDQSQQGRQKSSR